MAPWSTSFDSEIATFLASFQKGEVATLLPKAGAMLDGLHPHAAVGRSVTRADQRDASWAGPASRPTLASST
jgi:hypothetical protein